MPTGVLEGNTNVATPCASRAPALIEGNKLAEAGIPPGPPEMVTVPVGAAALPVNRPDPITWTVSTVGCP